MFSAEATQPTQVGVDAAPVGAGDPAQDGEQGVVVVEEDAWAVLAAGGGGVGAAAEHVVPLVDPDIDARVFGEVEGTAQAGDSGSDDGDAHVCIRCPMLNINPKMLPRLAELEEEDLKLRRHRAHAEGWIGEIEGIDLTLRFLADKQQQATRLQRITRTVNLGMPGEPLLPS